MKNYGTRGGKNGEKKDDEDEDGDEDPPMDGFFMIDFLISAVVDVMVIYQTPQASLKIVGKNWASAAREFDICR